MFYGKFHHLIDPKGRVSVPAPFREIIQVSGRSDLMLARCPVGPPPLLEGYTFSGWQELEEKILKLPKFSPMVLKLENFFFGTAHRCEVDNQGRILIPPALREWAALGKDVVFSGAVSRFRICDVAAWEQSQGEAEAAFKADPEFFSKLNL